MITRLLFILILSGLLFSCEPGSEIRYTVVNKTKSKLNLTVNPPTGIGLGASYDLKPNDEVTIFADKTLGYSSDIIELQTMNNDFLNCLRLTKDSINLKLDLTKYSSWTPESIGDTLAIYRLVIKSDETK